MLMLTRGQGLSWIFNELNGERNGIFLLAVKWEGLRSVNQESGDNDNDNDSAKLRKF
jgi:hypothetical protein